MASITKKVDRGISGLQRYQTFSYTDTNDEGSSLGAGDYFDIEASLGRPSSQVIIESESTDLQIRLNGIRKVYDRAAAKDVNWKYGDDQIGHLDFSTEREVVTSSPVETPGLPSGLASYVSPSGVPISNIYIEAYSTGTFTITAY